MIVLRRKLFFTTKGGIDEVEQFLKNYNGDTNSKMYKKATEQYKNVTGKTWGASNVPATIPKQPTVPSTAPAKVPATVPAKVPTPPPATTAVQNVAKNTTKASGSGLGAAAKAKWAGMGKWGKAGVIGAGVAATGLMARGAFVRSNKQQ